MANLVTLGRLILLFAIALPLSYSSEPLALWAVVGLVLVVFVLDAVDGWVARRLDQCTVYGAAFDIAADRVVENVLWIVLADLGYVPLWVPLVFLVRGLLVDSIRAVGVSHGLAPFSMTAGRLGHFLVAGRLMRITYAAVKAVAFIWIFGGHALRHSHPELWAQILDSPVALVSPVLYAAAAALCLLRGLPVLLVVFNPSPVPAAPVASAPEQPAPGGGGSAALPALRR